MLEPPPFVSDSLLCLAGAWLHLVLSTKTQQIMDSGQGYPGIHDGRDWGVSYHQIKNSILIIQHYLCRIC